MASLLLPLVLLIGSAIAIYLACEYFVNGIEWAGRRMSIGEQATGTVLAAFGTALPESIVTLVAVASGSAAGKELGVGAALGGPLALATIAYATVGVVMLATRQRLPEGGTLQPVFGRLKRDQGWFLLLFALKVALGLILFAGKQWTALIFLAAYVLYARAEMRQEAGADEEGPAEPLKLRRSLAVAPLGWALGQTLAALLVIFLASRLFVAQLGTLGPALGLAPQLVAMLLSPVATELPETMNAVIWVRQGKYRLALANISGAMMIQATVPTAFGLIFTPWMFGWPALVGSAATAAAIVTMYVAFSRQFVSRRLLAGMVGFYAAFVVVLVAS